MVQKLLEPYGRGPIPFAGTDNTFYERHLVFDNVVGLAPAGPRERFEGFARSVRDILAQRWIHTEETRGFRALWTPREALRKSLDVVEGACVERRRGEVGDG